jgi:hypothetical protein
MILFPKTIDLMSDHDRDFLNQKIINRLNSIAFHLRIVFLSNPDVNFCFHEEEKRIKLSVEGIGGRCSIDTPI